MQIINPYYQLFKAIDAQPEALQLELRKKLIWAYSWAIPSNDAISKIAEYSPLLEVGAGTGYWAWLLRQAGADVIATDREVQPPRWCDIQKADAEITGKHPDRTLLLCWPPFREDMALRALTNFKGQQLIYIGEWKGRTADTAFHDRLKAEWTVAEKLEIPSWPGFADSLYFLTRR